ncbi:MAG: hypothetical protein ACREFP_03150 [Acetobacteraceae bacterium]
MTDRPGSRGHYTASGKFVPRGGRRLQPRGDQVGGFTGKSIATGEAKQRYLVTLRETCSISAAIAASGRSRWGTRSWIRDDPAFAEDEMKAREEVIARLEKEAVRRAVEGVERPVVSAGKIVTTERVYSDPLLKTLLAAADPERFSRSGGGVAVQVNIGPDKPYTLRFEGDGRGPFGNVIDAEEKISEAEPLPEAARGDLP